MEMEEKLRFVPDHLAARVTSHEVLPRPELSSRTNVSMRWLECVNKCNDDMLALTCRPTTNTSRERQGAVSHRPAVLKNTVFRPVGFDSRPTHKWMRGIGSSGAIVSAPPLLILPLLRTPLYNILSKNYLNKNTHSVYTLFML